MSGRVFEVLRLPAVKKATGYGGSQIWEMIREGRFPKPIKLGARAVGWPEPEIAKWQAERVAERVTAAIPHPSTRSVANPPSATAGSPSLGPRKGADRPGCGQEGRHRAAAKLGILEGGDTVRFARWSAFEGVNFPTRAGKHCMNGVLLAAGITPDTQIEVRHPGADHLAVRAKVAARPSSASWNVRVTHFVQNVFPVGWTRARAVYASLSVRVGKSKHSKADRRANRTPRFSRC